MTGRLSDLKYKEVINLRDGQRLGCVCDAELDLETGAVCALIVPGPCRFLGLFWREEDYVIPWSCISRVGDDILLLALEFPARRGKREKRSWL